MLLSVLAKFLTFIASIFLFWLFIAWLFTPSISDRDATIKFKAFKQFYSINPDRWEPNEFYVTCIIKDRDKNSWLSWPRKQDFYFGFIDYQKYKRFYRKIKQDKYDVIKMKATAEMLSVVKEDIANMENLAQQQKEQAVDNITSILNNL